MEREEYRDRRRVNRLFADWPIGIIVVTAALSSLLTLAAMTLSNQVRPAPIYIEPPRATPTAGPTATPTPINVFVNGQVTTPGIYQLPYDALVDDAITAAGGFTTDAQIDIVNLAQGLVDGMQIYVPSRSESGGVNVPLISGSLDNGQAGITSDPSPGELVNINSATKAELETLPGVGPSTAQKILDYREDNGIFTVIEDIMNVSGIGPSKFDQMAPFITVGQ